MGRNTKQSGGSIMRCALVPILSVTLLGGCGQEAPEQQARPRLVNAMRVADTTGLAERAFPGRARAGQEVNLSFRVQGPLITFPVAVGDRVKVGDVVARLDPKDYETRLRTLEGQLEREQANLTWAEADLTRVRNIFRDDPGAISARQPSIRRKKTGIRPRPACAPWKRRWRTPAISSATLI